MSKAENKKSITKQINQLDEMVEWFYGEDFTLDQALDKYKSATKLAKQINQDLTELKNQVEIIEDFTKD